MANIDAPFGLRPLRHRFGGVIRMTEYPLSTACDTIGKGDAVLLNSGKVILATAGQVVLGCFQGVRVIDSTNSVTYDQFYASGTFAGAVSRTAFVIDDPNVSYAIQVDDGATVFSSTLNYVGQNADLLAHVVADSTTKQSVAQIEANTLASTVAQFRILGLYEAPDNVSDGSGNEIVEVQINEWQWAATGAAAHVS